MPPTGQSIELPELRAGLRPHGTLGPKSFSIVAAGLDVPRLDAALKHRREAMVDEIIRDRTSIKASIDTFVSWFRSAGHKCPLSRQFDRSITQGLPSGPAVVAALLYCEMTTGVLLGVQDLHAVDGTVRFDFAKDGERFDGFRGEVRCAQNEPVVRDDRGIIASVFQGPDLRTSVKEETRALMFYVFDSPDLDGEAFKRATRAVSDLMHDAGTEVAKRTIKLD